MGYIALMVALSAPFRRTISRGRRQGIDIIPARVRQAIAESGLSFAALAADADVSRQTMHNVASGKARPSAPVLEHIARRTGKSIEFFLPEATEPHALTEIGELQILCTSRRHAEAVAQGEAMLTRTTDPVQVAEIKLCLAEAYGCLGRSAEALQHVLVAKDQFEASGDRPKVVMCMDWQAWAVGIGGDPTEGLLLTEEALAECRLLHPVPVQTEISILHHMAAMRGMRREFELAAQLFDRAISLASEVSQSPWQMAKLYQNQSIVYHRLGLLVQASQMVQQALALHTIAGNATGIAQMEDNYGQLMMTLGRDAEAREHLERSLRMSEHLGFEHGRCQALLGLGTLHLKLGDLETAQTMLNQALVLAESREELAVGALVHQRLGQLSSLRGDWESTDREYGEALRLYERLDIPVQLSQCHQEYGEALAECGDHWSARVHLKAAEAQDSSSVVRFRPTTEAASQEAM